MLKALIADDDHHICSCLRNVIEWNDLGFELIGEAHNGLEIISFAKEHHIDVLLTDVKMPYMDGLEVCKYFQTHSPKTDIILLSAYDEFDIVREAINYNVCEYVLKPLTSEKLGSVAKILAGIFARFSHQQYAYYLLVDSGFKEQMWGNLKSENINYFYDIFTELETEYAEDTMLVRAICNRMISLFFDYMIHIGFPVEQINKKRQSQIEQVEVINTIPELLVIMKRMFSNVLQFSEETKETHYSRIVEQIKAYIHENYKNPMLSRSIIAEKLSLNPSYVSQIFADYGKMGIAQYIFKVRMEAAVEKLLSTTDSVSSISEAVGFSDSRYFSKSFKQHFGMPPADYRKKFHSIDSN